MKRWICLCLFLIWSGGISAQWQSEVLCSPTRLNPQDNDRFHLGIDVTGFFKNNEYFSPIVKGETLPGVRFMPYVGYQLSDRFRMELGGYNIYYSGDQYKEGTYAFAGIHAKLQYAFTSETSLTIGNYRGGVNHRLIEPLYTWEKHLTERPESGLQFRYEGERHFADVWVNWQRFIQHGDSVPEVLTFGASGELELGRKGRSRWSVPLQLLINHQGGQIDVSEERMIVAGNAAAGLIYQRDCPGRFPESWSMEVYLVGYYDKLPDNAVRPYESGWGIYPVVRATERGFMAQCGYWYAQQFYAFEGEPLFASFNPLYPETTLPRRSMLTLKLSYEKQLHRLIGFGGFMETYSDFKRGKTDYCFGVYLRFKGNFSLQSVGY